ncbi:hypothetical protein ACSCB1_35465 [Streptomyces europaeiscabiei]|uniref:hypothetical protein n=1 Tax=Streptomyces europaeiscabiei TaxID=146819 RepID=UPI000B2258BD|nr:hypothetical protein [Streptomyces europaeiscabiei]
MAKREVIFSDISGEMMQSAAEAARVRVFEHPDIEDPVKMDVLPAELEQLPKLAMKNVVEFDVTMPGESEPTLYRMTTANFAKFAGEKPMAEVLGEAEEADWERRTVYTAIGQMAVTSAPEKQVRDHTTKEWAGTPHKGKTSPEEASIVRRNIFEINETLASKGFRTVDPLNADHARRYGFTENHVEQYKAELAKRKAEAEQAAAAEADAPANEAETPASEPAPEAEASA